MRFQVPQFIDIEDKLFGPLTFKQFIYIGGGVGAAAAAWVIIPYKPISLLLGIPFLILGGLLAFYKPNNKPFIIRLEAMFRYVFGTKLYLWKKKPKELPTKKTSTIHSRSNLAIPSIGTSKLKDMSWELDTNKEGVSNSPTPKK